MEDKYREANRPATYAAANRDIIRPLLTPTAMWFGAFVLAIAAMLYGGYCWYLQITWGMGVAGIKHPTFWGVYSKTYCFLHIGKRA